MSNFFCANCNWQGNEGSCPLCGEITENLNVEEYSGMPAGQYDLSAQAGFSFAQDFEESPMDDLDEEL